MFESFSLFTDVSAGLCLKFSLMFHVVIKDLPSGGSTETKAANAPPTLFYRKVFGKDCGISWTESFQRGNKAQNNYREKGSSKSHLKEPELC